MTTSSDIIDRLTSVSTATVSTVLNKKGLRNVWIRGAFPIAKDQPRIAGPAFTLRFVPGREDLSNMTALGSTTSTRAAIEAMPEGCIAVADAGGNAEAGIVGDILCVRMRKRGVSGLVTDGVVRDLEGILDTGLPTWSSGTTAPPSFAGLTFVGWQETIGCGGVAVKPADMLLCDRDGCVVIPADMVDEVVADALEQEQVEAWILKEVEAGAKLTGLYPMNEETRARYEKSRKDD